MKRENNLNKKSVKSFEQLVFEKINRKINKRRLFLYTLSILFLLIGSVFFISKHLADLSYKNKNFQAKSGITQKKESVHITDKYYLPTANSNSRYLIQEVSYQPADNQI
jgi:hypothetical protein